VSQLFICWCLDQLLCYVSAALVLLFVWLDYAPSMCQLDTPSVLFPFCRKMNYHRLGSRKLTKKISALRKKKDSKPANDSYSNQAHQSTFSDSAEALSKTERIRHLPSALTTKIQRSESNRPLSKRRGPGGTPPNRRTARGPCETLGREPGPIKPGFVPSVSSPSFRL
jgi:hypothetical protein